MARDAATSHPDGQQGRRDTLMPQDAATIHNLGGHKLRQAGHPNGTRCSYQPPRRPQWHCHAGHPNGTRCSHQSETATMAGGTPKWHEMQLPASDPDGHQGRRDTVIMAKDAAPSHQTV
jgi:hypothetical protein